MKLISLNILGGRYFTPLMEFVEKHAPDADIFCFQEVFGSSTSMETRDGNRTDIFEKLSAALPDFRGYLAPEKDGYDFRGPVDYPLSHGQAAFVKKDISVLSEGKIFVKTDMVREEGLISFPANFEFLRLLSGGKKLTICNIHGIPRPGHKLDTPERLAQSRKLLDFFSGETGSKIICGDLNLMPDTQSVKILEGGGFRNLIKEFGIKDTRGKLSEYHGRPDYQGFADYIFASPEINISSFEVPDAGVSDHMPMILEFSLN